MSSNLPPQTPRRIAFNIIALVYILGVALYLAYGKFTDTGLSGWLTDWQMHHLDSASSDLTIAGNFLVWCISLVPMVYGLQWLNRAQGFTPNNLTLEQQQQNSSTPRTRRILAAVFALLAVGGFAYLTQAEAHLATQPVVRVDLDGTAPLPANTELAEVRGLLAATYAFIVEEVKYNRPTGVTTTYAPLLPSRWQPGQPVQFIVKTTVPFYQNPATGRVFALDSGQVFPATYDGHLRANSAPTFVSKHLASQHLTLASPYYVLDDQEVIQGIVRSPSTTRWMVLGVGLFMALSILMQKRPTA